jgi:hypothetical protein
MQQVAVSCAFCGEIIELLVDCTVPEQEYVEDCHVCCRPLVIAVAVDAVGRPRVSVRNEND